MKTDLGEAFLHAFSFFISHFYDLTDLLNEGLTLALQNELTSNLKQKVKAVHLLRLMQHV